MLLLAILAFSLWFMSTTTRRNLARASAGQIYMDCCLSAANEVLVGISESVRAQKPLAGLDFELALSKNFPFTAAEVEPALTRKMVERLWPGMKLGKVKIVPVDRSPPGDEDPLIGVIELIVKAEGDLGGARTGREVAVRLAFTVPCSTETLTSDEASYMRIHWGLPQLMTQPIAMRVVRL